MALLAAQPVAVTGTTPAYAEPTASDTIQPGGIQFLHVKNANPAPCTVTLVVPGTRYGQAVPDVAVVVPADTGDRMIFIPNEIADPATGEITVQFSIQASVTAGLFRL